MTKWILSLLSGLLIVSMLVVPARAAESTFTVYLDQQPVRLGYVAVSGDEQLRVDAESMLAADRLTVKVDGNTITASRPGLKVNLTVGSKGATVGGVDVALQAAVGRAAGYVTIALEDYARLMGKQLTKSVNGRIYYLSSNLRDRVYFAMGDSGVKYVGGKSGGKKSGDGKLYVDGVLLYEGQFAGDEMNGKGKLYLDGKLTYEGGFKGNAPDGFGTIYVGERYVGDVKSGKRHGVGKMFRGDAVLYDGEWADDRMTGAGRVYNSKQQLVYNGELLDGVRNGYGILYTDGVKSYQGNWDMGKKDGRGMLFDASGSVKYIGVFKDDQPNGKGAAASFGSMAWVSDGPGGSEKVENKDTSTIVYGSFVDGTQVSRDRTIYYTGQFNENKVPDGVGQLYQYTGNTVQRSGVLLSSALIYDGAVLDGKRQGSGKAYENGKLVYNGEFSDDVRKGRGKEYANGLLAYDGDWTADYRNGDGRAYQYSGNVAGYSGQGTVIVTEGYFMGGKLRTLYNTYRYVGELKSGVMTGKGSLYSISSSSQGSPFGQSGSLVFTGDFVDGRKNGPGKMYSGNAVVFEGSFADDKKNGKGTVYSGNIKLFEGNFLNDLRDGFGTEYSSYGVRVYEGEYRRDLRDGYGRLYENGILVYDGDFKDNKKHGLGKLYKNGQLIYEGEFVNDARADGK